MAKKKKKPHSRKQEDSYLEKNFLEEWKARYPSHCPSREYRFHPTRQFRFDFAWPTKKIAVEIQGYGPGHNSLTGMTQDYDKLLQALLLNWRIVYFTSIHISPNKVHESLSLLAQLLSIPENNAYIPLRRRRGRN